MIKGFFKNLLLIFAFLLLSLEVSFAGMPGAYLAGANCDPGANAQYDDSKYILNKNNYKYTEDTEGNPTAIKTESDKSCLGKGITQSEFKVRIEFAPNLGTLLEDPRWTGDSKPTYYDDVYKPVVYEGVEVPEDFEEFLKSMDIASEEFTLNEEKMLNSSTRVYFQLVYESGKACAYAYIHQSSDANASAKRWKVGLTYPESVEQAKELISDYNNEKETEDTYDNVTENCVYAPLPEEMSNAFNWGSLISEVCTNPDLSSSARKNSILVRVVECVEETLMNIFDPDPENGYKDASGNDIMQASFFETVQEDLKFYIRIILALAIIVFAFGYIMGAKELPKPAEFKWLVLKLSIVIYFAMGPGLRVILPMITSISKNLSSMIIDASSGIIVEEWDESLSEEKRLIDLYKKDYTDTYRERLKANQEYERAFRKQAKLNSEILEIQSKIEKFDKEIDFYSSSAEQLSNNLEEAQKACDKATDDLEAARIRYEQSLEDLESYEDDLASMESQLEIIQNWPRSGEFVSEPDFRVPSPGGPGQAGPRNESQIGEWEADPSVELQEQGYTKRYISMKKKSNCSANIMAEGSPSKQKCYEGTSIKQDINTQPGMPYKVRVSYLPSSCSAGNSETNVYWGGQKAGNLSSSNGRKKTITFDVIGSAGSTELKLSEEGQDPSCSGFIDNISIIPDVDAIEAEEAQLQEDIDRIKNTDVSELQRQADQAYLEWSTLGGPNPKGIPATEPSYVDLDGNGVLERAVDTDGDGIADQGEYIDTNGDGIRDSYTSGIIPGSPEYPPNQPVSNNPYQVNCNINLPEAKRDYQDADSLLRQAQAQKEALLEEYNDLVNDKDNDLDLANLKENLDKLNDQYEREYNAYKEKSDSYHQTIKQQGADNTIYYPGKGYNYCNYRDVDYPAGKSSFRVWDVLDCKMAKYLGISDNAENETAPQSVIISIVSVISTPFGILILVFFIVFIIYIFLLLFRIMHIYIIAFTAVIFLIFIGPMIIPAVLFKWARYMFTAWLRELIGYLLQPVVLFAFLSLVFMAIDKVYFGGNHYFDENNRIIVESDDSEITIPECSSLPDNGYLAETESYSLCNDRKTIGYIIQTAKVYKYPWVLGIELTKVDLSDHKDIDLLIGYLKLNVIIIISGIILSIIETLSAQMSGATLGGAARISSAPIAQPHQILTKLGKIPTKIPTVSQVGNFFTTASKGVTNLGKGINKGVDSFSKVPRKTSEAMSKAGDKSQGLYEKTGKGIKNFKGKVNDAGKTLSSISPGKLLQQKSLNEQARKAALEEANQTLAGIKNKNESVIDEDSRYDVLNFSNNEDNNVNPMTQRVNQGNTSIQARGDTDSDSDPDPEESKIKRSTIPNNMQILNETEEKSGIKRNIVPETIEMQEIKTTNEEGSVADNEQEEVLLNLSFSEENDEFPLQDPNPNFGEDNDEYMNDMSESVLDEDEKKDRQMYNIEISEDEQRAIDEYDLLRDENGEYKNVSQGWNFVTNSESDQNDTLGYKEEKGEDDKDEKTVSRDGVLSSKNFAEWVKRSDEYERERENGEDEDDD